MAEFKFFCPCCGQAVQCDTGYCGSQINCPACQQAITVPPIGSPIAPQPSQPAAPSAVRPPTIGIRKSSLIVSGVVALLLVAAGAALVLFPQLRGRSAGLVAAWTANGSTKDVVSGRQAVLMNGASFSEKSFRLDNTAGIHSNKYSNVFPPPAFDGGEYVQVPHSDAWAFGKKDFTIELWANFNSVPVHDIGHPQGGVFISNDEGPYNANKWLFALGGGVLNFHINDPKHGPVFLVKAPFRPELQEWYHFAITRRQNVFTIYVNGKAMGSERSSREIPDSNAPLNIGEAEGYYFDGSLEGIGLYQRALSAAEIRNIFDAGENK